MGALASKTWSNNDLEWLERNYPSVKITPGGTLTGQLLFRMLFHDGKRYINPSDKLLATSKGVYITAMYGVQIEHHGKDEFPTAFEIGGKIQGVADKKGLTALDMHTFPKDGSLCLASPMAILPAVASGLTLKAYFEDFLIPYLFAQEHFARYNSWPWGELSHGHLGHLEWLGRKQNPKLLHVRHALFMVQDLAKEEYFQSLFATRPRMHHPCVCNSGKKFRDCHPDVKKAITEVRKLVYSRRIDLREFS